MSTICGRWVTRRPVRPEPRTGRAPGVVDMFVTLGLPVHVIRDKDPEHNAKGQAWAEGVRRDLTTAGLEVHVRSSCRLPRTCSPSGP